MTIRRELSLLRRWFELDGKPAAYFLSLLNAFQSLAHVCSEHRQTDIASNSVLSPFLKYTVNHSGYFEVNTRQQQPLPPLSACSVREKLKKKMLHLEKCCCLIIINGPTGEGRQGEGKRKREEKGNKASASEESTAAVLNDRHEDEVLCRKATYKSF